MRELDRACQSERSELIILYGRRRVGKTFLVRSYFHDTYDFHFVGAHNKKQATQLSNFRKALVRYGYATSTPFSISSMSRTTTRVTSNIGHTIATIVE